MKVRKNEGRGEEREKKKKSLEGMRYTGGV